MHLCTPVHIPNFLHIQQQLLVLAQELFAGEKNTSRRETTQQQIHEHCPELIEFLNNKNLIFSSARFFYTCPGGSIPIHLDGTHEETRELALNLPVLGCKNTEMLWWDNLDQTIDVVHPDLGNILRTFDGKSKTVIHSLELLEPTLCKVDVPHNVINPTDTPRIAWSVRFKIEPTDLFYQKSV